MQSHFTSISQVMNLKLQKVVAERDALAELAGRPGELEKLRTEAGFLRREVGRMISKSNETTKKLYEEREAHAAERTKLVKRIQQLEAERQRSDAAMIREFMLDEVSTLHCKLREQELERERDGDSLRPKHYVDALERERDALLEQVQQMKAAGEPASPPRKAAVEIVAFDDEGKEVPILG